MYSNRDYYEAIDVPLLRRWRVSLWFSGSEHIDGAPEGTFASLKRAFGRKIFPQPKNFQRAYTFFEPMRYNQADYNILSLVIL